jgi:hypothetical protein
MLDVNDPKFLPLWQEMEKSLDVAWQAALKVIGCVECARVELVQRLRGNAEAKNIEIMGGVDWVNDDSASIEDAPMEKDGISRVCKNYQEPPPEGAIRFFKHGTDELLKQFCNGLLQSVGFP